MPLIIDYLFPRTCYSCGQTGGYFCSNCQTKLDTLSVTYPSAPSPLDGYLQLFRYKNSIRQAIEDLKYNFCYDIIPSFSSLVCTQLTLNYPNLLKYWQTNNFSLVPIPLHWSRQNWRGYNQSELLANHLASLLKLTTSNVLIRPHYSSTQVSQVTKQARLTNIQGVFATCSQVCSVGQNFLIIDDVITTSATITQAAHALKASQASSLWAISLAG